MNRANTGGTLVLLALPTAAVIAISETFLTAWPGVYYGTLAAWVLVVLGLALIGADLGATNPDAIDGTGGDWDDR